MTGMTMAKADKDDFDTTYRLHQILQAAKDGNFLPDDEDSEWTDFDCDSEKDLRKFFDQLMDALDNNPSGMMRVVGAASTLLYEKNQIVDPDKDYIDLHPRFGQTQQQRDELRDAAIDVIAISDRKHDAWDRLKAAIDKAKAVSDGA